MGRNTNELFWLEQYDNGPYGGSALVPSARRNMAGRPGMHGLPRGAMGDPEMMKLTKVELKALAAGKSAKAQRAQAELERRGGSKHMRVGVAQPKSRKTERSRKLRATKVRSANKAAPKAPKAPAKPKAAKGVRSAQAGTMTKPQMQAAMAKQLVAEGHAPDFISAIKIVREQMKAKPNSRYVPDFTHTREALIPMSWSRPNPGLSRSGALWPDFWDPNYEQAQGQFGISEPWTSGIQPMSRRNEGSRKRAKGKKKR
jgi:hypothetical protein